MSTTLRTRLLALVSTATLVGVVGGTAVAFAGQAPAPRSGEGQTSTCQSAPVQVEQTQVRWFGHGLRTAM